MKKICVGVLDSGIGGLSVIKELLKYPLGVRFLYLGDNKNAPYGNKSKRELFNLTKSNIDYLKSNGAESFIFACNTLSVTFLKGANGNVFNEKIFGVFPPVDAETKNALLLCTEKTAAFYKDEKNLTVFALKNLAYDIENNAFNLCKVDIKKHLKGLNGSFSSVILGCTHYFFVKNKIIDHLKPQKIYGGEKITAKNFYECYKDKCFPCENEVVFIGENAKLNRDFYEKVVKQL